MIIRLKVKELRYLDNDIIEIMAQCEEFDKMLLQRSPNLLIDHLNNHYKLNIEYITKEAKQ